ncbi:ricin-type beta-trefoil lectin domain protein [Streptomyces sp. MS06]|uniref:ricin-type beta-trefoil lectin domain protein n=1 Tax=Streptomyces sp. MS06 TaxID=3385974 RepID=UPI00399F5834
MNTAGSPHTPGSAHPPAPSDAQLSTRLRSGDGTSPAPQPVAELLDRHWEPVFGYARLCTDDTPAAGMLTTTAFTRLFGDALRNSGPSAAWRPDLLVTVRRMAAEWRDDDRSELLHPALRGAGDSPRPASDRLLPPPHRHTLSRAFQRLPQSARCVLWHSEAEAEPPDLTAAVLGMDPQEVGSTARRARERLRTELLQVHRETAPGDDCRLYQRLLEVTDRRDGGSVDPDLRRHLDHCRHCRCTADQLARFHGGLGLALAEAVLGWGARDYTAAAAVRNSGRPDRAGPCGPGRGQAAGGHGHRAPTAPAGASHRAPAAPPGGPPTGYGADPGEEDRSRPVPGKGRSTVRTASAATGTSDPRIVSRGGRRAGPGRPPGGHRAAARRAVHRARAARRRTLGLAALAASAAIALPAALWFGLGASGAGSGRAAGPARSPATGGAEPTAGPSWTGLGAAGRGALTGRLHNAGSRLCVAVVGGSARPGAETELAGCSSAPAQQWAYEADGLLRSVAAPGLCLDSHLGYSVRLSPCTTLTRPGGRNIRYDFTVQGVLVPRWNQDLALTPAATDGSGALVLKNRAALPVQHWTFDTASAAGLRMKAVNWNTPSPRPTGNH